MRHIFCFFCSVLCYFMFFCFLRNAVCAGYHRKHWSRQFVHCALIPFSHTIYTHSNPTLLLSLVAWHKGDCSFPTHHLKREKIKKTQRDSSIFGAEKTHSVTAAILCEITVGSHGPSRLCILLASLRWWLACLHWLLFCNVSTYCLGLTTCIYICHCSLIVGLQNVMSCTPL